MLRLTMNESNDNTCFSPPLPTKEIQSLFDTSKPESFLQVASLIDWIKRQFEIRYHPNVHWLTNEKSRWSGCSQQIKNSDILTFKKQQLSIEIEIIWYAEINKNQELRMNIIAKIDDKTNFQLPLGVWKQYEQEKILKDFESELKILIEILYKNKNM